MGYDVPMIFPSTAVIGTALLWNARSPTVADRKRSDEAAGYPTLVDDACP
jgi:hypothetical protein